MSQCDGLCVDSADIGVPGYGVAYPHPGCPLHAPEQVCGCGHPDRCLSPTHGQIALAEALSIRHRQHGGDDTEADRRLEIAIDCAEEAAWKRRCDI